MMDKTQFLVMLPSTSLSFHEPSEEYMMIIRMDERDGVKRFKIGQLRCRSELPTEPELAQSSMDREI
jgi:hypothetical protein